MGIFDFFKGNKKEKADEAKEEPAKEKTENFVEKKVCYHINSKGKTYHLHSKDVVLRGGRNQTIYYFAKDLRPNACSLPSGKTVVENTKTGIPFLVDTAKKNPESIEEINEQISIKKNLIAEAKALIKKYTEQQKNVRNNREFDSLTKETEYQELEIQLAEKNIKEFKAQLEQKNESIDEIKSISSENPKHLENENENTGHILVKIDEESFFEPKSEEKTDDTTKETRYWILYNGYIIKGQGDPYDGTLIYELSLKVVQEDPEDVDYEPDFYEHYILKGSIYHFDKDLQYTLNSSELSSSDDDWGELIYYNINLGAFSPDSEGVIPTPQTKSGDVYVNFEESGEFYVNWEDCFTNKKEALLKIKEIEDKLVKETAKHYQDSKLKEAPVEEELKENETIYLEFYTVQTQSNTGTIKKENGQEKEIRYQAVYIKVATLDVIEESSGIYVVDAFGEEGKGTKKELLELEKEGSLEFEYDSDIRKELYIVDGKITHIAPDSYPSYIMENSQHLIEVGLNPDELSTVVMSDEPRFGGRSAFYVDIDEVEKEFKKQFEYEKSIWNENYPEHPILTKPEKADEAKEERAKEKAEVGVKEVRSYILVDEIDIGHISEKYNGSIYTIFEVITDNPDDVSDADRINLFEVYNGEIDDPRTEFSEEEYDIYDENHEVENEVEYFKDNVYGDGEVDDKWDLCWKESERKEFEEEVDKILKITIKDSAVSKQPKSIAQILNTLNAYLHLPTKFVDSLSEEAFLKKIKEIEDKLLKEEEEEVEVKADVYPSKRKISKSKKIYYSNEDDYSSEGKGSDWSVNELIGLIKSNPNLKLRAVSCELCYGVFQIKDSNYPKEIFAYYNEQRGQSFSQKVKHSYFMQNMSPNELLELVKNENYDPKKEAYQTRFHFWEYGSIDNKTLLGLLNEFISEDESNKAVEISEFLYWYAENSGNWTPEMFVNSLWGGDGEYNQGITSNANLLQENISEKTKNDIGFYIIEDSMQTDYGIFEIL